MAIEAFESIRGSELIQDCFLFKNLNFSEAQEMAKICHREHRAKGEVIIEENSLGEALYLIENGEVEVIKVKGRFKEVIATLGRGEMFGEMSLVENELTSATVQALTDVDLFVIHRADFESLIGKDDKLALKIYKSFCKTLSERLRKTTDELSLCHKGMKRKGSSRKPKAKARKVE